MSFDRVQRRLDSVFQRSQTQLDQAAVQAAEGASLEDISAFTDAMMQHSRANWAVSRVGVLEHNLAKAILNEIH
ncbi:MULTISPECIES: serine kinase [Pseudomonas]|uniref:serine kinase n=1 Tax=Pseudomonas TaxID=286 RepID=UPI000BAC0867|nr:MULTISPECIES: serine kinase [Pseudomonas]MBU3057505.1 type III secretion protein HrpF [Pseudomonas indica]PAU57205.1 hypothetical protein BZL41_18955 [Pseudomonas sp. PIC25]